MAQYRYEAKKGRDLVKGILSAASKDEAIDKINEMGLVPVELAEGNPEEKKHRGFSGVRAASFKGGDHTVAVFYRQLGRLLKSGVPLLPALVLVSEQSEDRKLRPVFETVRDHVRQGRSLAAAMAEHPRVFNPFPVAMVELGENTGHLDDALRRLAECYEKQSAVLQKVKNALTYPAFVVVLGSLAFIFLLAYVVPKFSRLFADLGQTLPLLTRSLIWVSEGVQRYGLAVLLAVSVLMMFFRRRLRQPRHRLVWDRMKMGFPLFGPLVFMAQFAVFARSMEILLKGGVPLLKAIRTGLPAVSNEAMKEDLAEVQRQVEQGASLSESLKNLGSFPVFAVHLLLIGEQTGRLEQSFADIADWYEQEVEAHTRAMTQLIEPITLLVIGAALGFIAIAILLPVFSMDAIIS